MAAAALQWAAQRGRRPHKILLPLIVLLLAIAVPRLLVPLLTDS